MELKVYNSHFLMFHVPRSMFYVLCHMNPMTKFQNILLRLGLFLGVFLPLVIFAQTPPPVERSISVTVTVPGSTPAPTLTPPGGGGGGVVPFPQPGPAKVIFKGMAYPGAHITILKNGKVAGTVSAFNTGDFEYAITGLASGLWSFGFFAEDTEGRKSVTVSFSTNILGGADTTISGIFISPTISLSGSAVKKGNNIDIFGQAYPLSDVNIFVASPVVFNEKTTAAENGKWQYAFNTDSLEFGNHTARAKAVTLTGDQSPFSEEMAFKVIEGCRGADLNFDNKVDLIDFSILLYFWNQTKPSNACSDINGNGIVDLTDFSIMMYWWNG